MMARALFVTGDAENPLELSDAPDPAPTANQAIVRVRAATINRGELALIASRPRGWRPGQDFAGEVVATAADGSGPKVGARVVGFAEGGSWTDAFAVDVARLGMLPDGVSFEQAATLPASAMTALRILRFGGLLIGRSVLVTAALGSVGAYAVELAEIAGADVTALVRPESADAARTLWPAIAIVTDSAELRGPFDLTVEAVGGGVLERALATAAPGGVVVPFGNLSGEPSRINAFGFVGHEGARVQSFLSYAAGPIEAIGKDLTLLAALVGQGRLHPRVARVISWRDAGEAIRAMRGGGSDGKTVLRVA